MTTPTLMTAAEMRAHLNEKRTKSAVEATQIAEQEAARLNMWAAEQLAKMLGQLYEGALEDYHNCDTSEGADAIAGLAHSLGYASRVDLEDDTYYVVIKAPELGVGL